MTLHPNFWKTFTWHSDACASNTRHALYLVRRARYSERNIDHNRGRFTCREISAYSAERYGQGLLDAWRFYSWAQKQGIVLG